MLFSLKSITILYFSLLLILIGNLMLTWYSPSEIYLSCNDLEHIRPIRLLARGAVKNIWLVEWNYHHLVMARLRVPEFTEDFKANLQNLQFLHQPQQNTRVVQLLGHCGTSTIFTKYYRQGSALNLPRLHGVLGNLSWCIDYVEIIAMLHEHSMVMCDSNTLGKTLSQFMITDDLRLVLNDCDALPRVPSDGGGIQCGPRPLAGDFIAPEQHGFDHRGQLPVYDCKTDIWKVPDVCHWFLADSRRLHPLARAMLHWIHSKCKHIDPRSRPSALNVLKVYRFVNKYLSFL